MVHFCSDTQVSIMPKKRKSSSNDAKNKTFGPAACMTHGKKTTGKVHRFSNRRIISDDDFTYNITLNTNGAPTVHFFEDKLMCSTITDYLRSDRKKFQMCNVHELFNKIQTLTLCPAVQSEDFNFLIKSENPLN